MQETKRQFKPETEERRLERLSKFISMILRHKPEVIGITLDEHGWADVDELIKGINETGEEVEFSKTTLEKIVKTDKKQRYSVSQDKTLIRANQGHSIPVDVELEKKEPPKILYHGTGVKSVKAIQEQGLLPMERLYVHLSTDVETATNVGKRHGTPVIFKVNTEQMQKDGYDFFQSVNGVWLTKEVPAKYLELN
ncbi:RNA 2'-phosphotransferase [Anaerobutyricum soehngenii]|uniref:RNA 2'-phosphotransferase n=1 Tax=Anaerobutyricum soehngenii TaxID=105843 RepID=UPI0032C02FFE